MAGGVIWGGLREREEVVRLGLLGLDLSMKGCEGGKGERRGGSS